MLCAGAGYPEAVYLHMADVFSGHLDLNARSYVERRETILTQAVLDKSASSGERRDPCRGGRLWRRDVQRRRV